MRSARHTAAAAGRRQDQTRARPTPASASAGRVQAVQIAQLVGTGASRQPERTGQGPGPAEQGQGTPRPGARDERHQKAPGQEADQHGGELGPLPTVDDQRHLEPGQPAQGVGEVGHSLTPQPPGSNGGHRARRGRRAGAGRPDEPGDDQRARAEGQPRPEGDGSGRSGPQPGHEQPRPHPDEGGDGERGVPHRQPADESQPEDRPPSRRRHVSFERAKADEKWEAGDEGHEEIGRRTGRGHQSHVGRAPGGQERRRPPRAHAAHLASEKARQHDEQKGAGELVEAEDRLVRAEGEARREQVGVEGSVVGLVPQRGRQLAAEDVPGHEKQDRVVVGDRQRPGHPVKGAPSDGEDREQGGDDEQSASPGHVGRVCPSRLPVYRLRA